MIRLLDHIGDAALHALDQVGRMVLMLMQSMVAVLRPPYDLFSIVRQLYFIGVRSLLVIVISGLFTGMVLALQFYNTLDRFGSMEMLGSTTALALIRELGPVMAALMVVADRKSTR
ncbi:MAG TPA: ABC transporter permease, partial [Kiloniellaceae bacterium]|nr:ABC transporter permease [Kiloniellaceae bacterium]